MSEGSGPVIGVIGASGGVGASTLAAVLAVVAGGRGAGSVLLDLDVAGGGVDVLLGIETQPGARWSNSRLAGGHLDPVALRDGLPRAGPCSVLAADVAELDPGDVDQVIAAAEQLGTVVLDLPRSPCAVRAAALPHCDLVVVLARADVVGLVAAHGLVSALPELPVGVVVRRGDVAVERAARFVGAPRLGVLPPLGAARRAFDPTRLPRATARIASGVLDGATGLATGYPARPARSDPDPAGCRPTEAVPW